jgi:hypothetical protein
MIVPPMANLLSLLAFLAYGSFLSLPRRKRSGQELVNPLDPEQGHERPRVWVFPILEWAVFFSTVAWLFGVAPLAQI